MPIESIPLPGAQEPADFYAVRMTELQFYQTAPQAFVNEGHQLTQEEMAVLTQWSNANVQMAQTARLFAAKLIVEDMLAAPVNGCQNCCANTTCSTASIL